MFVKFETTYSCGHTHILEFGNVQIENDFLNLLGKKESNEICVDCFFENTFNNVIKNN